MKTKLSVFFLIEIARFLNQYFSFQSAGKTNPPLKFNNDFTQKCRKKKLEINDKYKINLNSKFVQVDEIWTFLDKKQKQLTVESKIL